VSYTLLTLAIAGFTCVHHFQPHLLQVPNPSDVASWKNSSFVTGAHELGVGKG